MNKLSTSFTPAFLSQVLIFFLLCILQVQGELNEAACSSSCGDIHNIKYPFRLRGDPSSCGDPDYEFSCVSNKTILKIFPGKYYVKNISYTENRLRLVDVNLANGSCSLPSGSLKDRNGNVQDFRYKGLVDLATEESLIRFVNCSSNATLQFNKSALHYNQGRRYNPGYVPDYNYTEIPCLSRNGSYMYAVVDGMYKINKYPKTCSLVSLAPVDYHDTKMPTYEGATKAMKDGFDVAWSVECRNCALAGKHCGITAKAWETRPIIFECNGDYHELTWGEMRSIIVGCVMGGVIFVVIILALVVCGVSNCKKRKQKRKTELQNQQSSTL